MCSAGCSLHGCPNDLPHQINTPILIPSASTPHCTCLQAPLFRHNLNQTPSHCSHVRLPERATPSRCAVPSARGCRPSTRRTSPWWWRPPRAARRTSSRCPATPPSPSARRPCAPPSASAPRR
ncbi:hypothetical protein ABB37_02571 [Leptomonas pyrrhocoris]|uniref:Uncharacterized protein n=1 Tax=Leptomonas pyrrhocoris TaxID=157538 RepID=A0A0M9G5F8_LEPPY|nr:hypothetical protein ABB37_02566 [Leptomonas pyrrhocoris]XP_015661226.1 hypothetical protein ABB37_02569 [Leptomonas pyrrhocoris]XP_015661229.1 hypothetical protein ABB37_02571 [Leptomonas pyrrhocoris]KPA82783.1 hypothetical protein ABB37_02566 [Leptomonas pyrrhocoris]KPA82787.1 hypothetical protein ABB37_02569 [Leptomonas pyrrhocoris]KPA82790.1 hypothetical protein ABB37_02571 [Leptomonas pyrrhocoris]|eukprot:XP_015661222.1 hypothetical protein ABB37_02566 [Leptomonas pyrrhocoris]